MRNVMVYFSLSITGKNHLGIPTELVEREEGRKAQFVNLIVRTYGR